ncbi:glycosyltransferase [Paucidesulfovibrio longus]|uniref:glycosyltransferase n=1 Tax=Paucidesulfovibrio longus TaxID=889 RepID=UPI0003B4643B|nr:glycosyltransferase [Paucidesulfovibrio longus]
MRVYYQLGEYVSHAQAGRANMAALAGAGHELVDDPAKAHVAVIHDEPPFLPGHLERLRREGLPAGTPVAAYCVFEAAPLPEAFAAPLQLADEVWTCSEFSRDIFAPRVQNVHVIPHAVERTEPAEADLARVAALLGHRDDTYWFYTIADAANRRKNLLAALRAFAGLRAELHPGQGSGQSPDQPRGPDFGSVRVGFVVKQYRHSLDLSHLPGVLSLEGEFTDGEIAALHRLCRCYVSPHRAEAWGLGLSEALAEGNRVIATGWSGNMTFMDERNSRPLPFRIVPVTETDLAALPPYFQAGMLWAEPDLAALQREMRRALRGTDPDMRLRAQAVTKRFSPARVGRMMTARLRALRPDRD